MPNRDSVNATQVQGRAVSATAPTDGQYIKWVAANSDFEPATMASSLTYPDSGSGVSGQTLPDTPAFCRTRDNIPSQLVAPTNLIAGTSWLIINDGTGTWTMPDGVLTVLTMTARILVLVQTPTSGGSTVYKLI